MWTHKSFNYERIFSLGKCKDHCETNTWALGKKTVYVAGSEMQSKRPVGTCPGSLRLRVHSQMIWGSIKYQDFIRKLQSEWDIQDYFIDLAPNMFAHPLLLKRYQDISCLGTTQQLCLTTHMTPGEIVVSDGETFKVNTCHWSIWYIVFREARSQWQTEHLTSVERDWVKS